MATANAQEYAGMLSQVQPPHAVDILNNRVQQIGRLNFAVADWLKERRRLEEQYSNGLRVLAHRRLDGVDLGIFSGPWATLTGSVATLADSHDTLASKIEVDIERPLREFTSNSREMTAVTTMQGNLAELAREVEKAQQKTEKLLGKGERAESGKVASATSDLDSAQAQWNSQAPYVFESLQALDTARLNQLRDALAQFQTHEMDATERNRVSSEQCLIVLLNAEPADEIKAFALRAPQSKAPSARAPRASVAYGTPTRNETPSAPVELAANSMRSEEDLSRQRTGSTDEKGKGKAKGGLRRLGTVLGRGKRESKIPAGFGSTSESPDSRPKPSTLNSFGSRFGRSRDNNTPTLSTMQEDTPRQRPAPPPQLGSEIFNPPAEVSADPLTPPSTSNRHIESFPPQVNGTAFASPTEERSAFAPAAAGAAAVVAGGVAVAAVAAHESHAGDLNDLEPPRPAFTERKESLRALEGQKDAEGYSVPPQNLDPISQAQQDAALADEGSSPALNVNIRDAPIQDSAASDADLASMANKLQAPPPSTKRNSTIRGRRTDRNSTFVSSEQSISEADAVTSPSAISDASLTRAISSDAPPPVVTDSNIVTSPSSTVAPASALSTAAFSPFTPVKEPSLPLRTDTARTDTQSIRSATTTGSQAGMKHPDFTEPGLHSSIVETLSARFENKQLVSSSLIGEVALAFNPPDFSSPFSNETIRLENFSSLEKVAPNPAFIQPIADKAGEYTLNLSSIARTQVAFKYQTRLEDGLSQAPLLITPALKIEATQCSIIVSYTLNPAFNLNGAESLTISNVTLALTVEGTKAASCQSRPMGTFSRERNLIYWQLGDIKLAPGAVAEKVLARFATESEASGASVEARWEINGESASALGGGLSVSSLNSGGEGDGADPFADEDGSAGGKWKTVGGTRKLVSGSYVAK